LRFISQPTQLVSHFAEKHAMINHKHDVSARIQQKM